MNILFITPTLPFPPTDGHKIRVHSLLSHLAQKHRVFVASFLRTTEDSKTAGFAEMCAGIEFVRRNARYSVSKLMRGILGQNPFGVINYYDPAMVELVRNFVSREKIDVVQAESLFMAQYCVDLPCKKILNLHNIESLLVKRYAHEQANPLKRAYAEITWRKLEQYERKIFCKFDRILTCSSKEEEMVLQWSDRTQISTIPNGVDVQRCKLDRNSPVDQNRIVFVGRMDYHANIDAVDWFARETLPLIRAQRPNIQLQIVGGYPTKAVKMLGLIPGVQVTGFVDDVRVYLSAAACVVVPLRVGAGTRLKILEALAMGKAIVSTSIGAEGLDVTSGKELIIADDPEQFAEQVLCVLSDDILRTDLGIAGRELVEHRYSWEVIGAKLEQAYEHL
jgi:sugar transferase (PEP-CTERM/EpsH1 system associated)